MTTTFCPDCGIASPSPATPHRRPSDSEPACAAAYRALLKRERSDLRCMRVHALTVDAYIVQHPASHCDDAVRSLGAHLLSLYGQLVLELPYRDARVFRDTARATIEFRALPRPDSLGELTVLHALAAETPDEHVDRVVEWGWSCWRAWAPHHEQVMSWTRRLLGEIPRPKSRRPEGLGWWSGGRNAILPHPEGVGPFGGGTGNA